MTESEFSGCSPPRKTAMQANDEIEVLRQDLASLQARLDELEKTAAPGTSDLSVTRRGLLMGLAGAGAAAVAGVAAAEPAAAADGDALLLGSPNNSSTTSEIAFDAGNGPAQTAALIVAAANAYAIEARSQNFPGVLHVVNDGFGGAIYAESDSQFRPTVNAGNSGTSAGLAAASLGGGPQLILWTEVADGVDPLGPGDAYPFQGAIRVDANGDFWLCTYGPTEVPPPGPPRWTRLAREDDGRGLVFPITPIRVLDTRATGGRPSGSPAVPGQTQGPLKGGTVLTLNLAALASIPDDAQAVIGNLTVTAPNFGGYLKALPSGSSSNVSSLNWSKGATVANAFTCKLGPAGVSLVGSGTSSQTYQLVVDITAYVR